jgi:eukaryotic-like serine/threonine-protein kinase
MTFTLGTNLDGYEAPGPLGAGGTGEVCRACDPVLKPEVANKALPPYASQAPDPLRRLEQEEQAAAVLSHPNILTVDRFGTFEGGKCLVAKLLEGEVLGTYAMRRKSGNKDLFRDDGRENEWR